MRLLVITAILALLIAVDVSAQGIVFDDNTIRAAVDLWYEDRTAAEAQYGPIVDWNTGEVTSFQALFYRGDRENTTNTFNEDIGSWNTSSVTNLRSMFFNATKFNQDISGWDTTNVNTMRTMFYGATSFNSPLSGWNTANVVNFEGMFDGAVLFNQPLNTFDTSSAMNMAKMFHGSAFDQPINTWNTSSVTEFGHMFENCPFNQPLDNFDTRMARDMTHMFRFNPAFNQPLVWETETVIGMQEMFRGATSFNQAVCWNLTGIVGNFNADTARMFCDSQGSFDPACNNIAPVELREAAFNCSDETVSTVAPPASTSAPIVTETIADVLMSDDRFTTLVMSADEIGLLPGLAGPAPLTLFAPTNDAFVALNLAPDTDPTVVEAILMYHVANGMYDVQDGTAVPTLYGSPVLITVTATESKANNATITETLGASNGVIYVVDAVLIPPSPPPTDPPTMAPIAVTQPTDPPATTTASPVATASPVVEPTTASPVAEPTTSSPFAVPTTASPVAEPTTASPVVEPTTSSPVAEPTTASPVAEPTTASPVAEPTTASPVVEPTSSPVVEPTTASPVAEPTTASPVAEPTTASPVTQPSAAIVRPPVSDRTDPPAPTVSPAPTTSAPPQPKKVCHFCPGGARPKAHPKTHIYTNKNGQHITCGRLKSIMKMMDDQDIESGKCAAYQKDARYHCCGPPVCSLCTGGRKPTTPPHKYIYTDKYGKHVTCGQLHKEAEWYTEHDVYSGKCAHVQKLASRYCCSYPPDSTSSKSKSSKKSKRSEHHGYKPPPYHKQPKGHKGKPYKYGYNKHLRHGGDYHRRKEDHHSKPKSRWWTSIMGYTGGPKKRHGGW